jgi:hypothetical protein
VDVLASEYSIADQGSRQAIDTAFRVASNVAKTVADGFHPS